MSASFRHIEVTRNNDAVTVHFRRRRMSEADILELADELKALVRDQGCRKMALALGPGQLECLYSVFLAKLVMLRRSLLEQGGKLALCAASPETMAIFEACQLKELFDFQPDLKAGLAAYALTNEPLAVPLSLGAAAGRDGCALF
jgi:anti-anti-sigma regulatory factor